ncbi:MAG: M42 family metallopeptidase [Massilimaliae sp.]|nr:M42 family metallopeptidase [Massiliimalia sp.]
MWERIERYCRLNGVSGDEGLIRNAILEEVKAYCQYEIDAMGNLICFKKGMVTPDKKLMLCAHMDEVGFIITHVTEDGLLKFTTVGGIDSRVVLGRAVSLYRTGTTGVIGTKAIHQQTEKERETVVDVKDMFIDIGASSREEALGAVTPGDCAVFCTEFEEFGNGFVKGKALDDRIGCAVLVELIRSKLKFDTYFVFTTQEEVGLRGAKAAAYSVDPDFAVVVETTTAADLSGVSEQKQVCCLGKGAVVGFMDRAAIYDRDLYALSYKLAVEKKITAQTKTMVAGGNDAGAIQTSRGGTRTIAVSAPCRYLHSGVCTVKKDDVRSVLRLVHELAENIL